MRLLARGDAVLGVDNLNDYYDVTLKEARLVKLTLQERFTFIKADIARYRTISPIAKQWSHCSRRTNSMSR